MIAAFFYYFFAVCTGLLLFAIGCLFCLAWAASPREHEINKD